MWDKNFQSQCVQCCPFQVQSSLNVMVRTTMLSSLGLLCDLPRLPSYRLLLALADFSLSHSFIHSSILPTINRPRLTMTKLYGCISQSVYLHIIIYQPGCTLNLPSASLRAIRSYLPNLLVP